MSAGYCLMSALCERIFADFAHLVSSAVTNLGPRALITVEFPQNFKRMEFIAVLFVEYGVSGAKAD